MKSNFLHPLPGPERPFFSRRKWLAVVVAILAVLAVAPGAAAIYKQAYRGRVYPGVYFGSYHLGGFTAAQVRDTMENFNNRYAKEGVALRVTDASGKTSAVVLALVGAGDSAEELASIDSAAATNAALALGRSGNWFARLGTPALYGLFSWHSRAPVVSNPPDVVAAARGVLHRFEDVPHNAGLVVTKINPLQYQVTPAKAGWVIDYAGVAETIRRRVSSLSFEPVSVAVTPVTPTITPADAEQAAGELPAIVNYGALQLNYIDPETSKPIAWAVTPAEFSLWLEVRHSDGRPIIAFQKEAVERYLDATIRLTVDEPAKDAKFVVNTTNNRVEKFQASATGWRLNGDQTYADLDAAFRERNYQPQTPLTAVAVTVDILEPEIKTADVNNLGITEIIGVGTSTFYGSHVNRIRNITTASKRLNGVIIKPGEEFSTNKFAGPYTPESGYLPELVIKGKEIKKEVGGGMCQIGTTLFRMAMNTGLPITERRNHSLVVNYYFDPVNHLPGTDATVYDPLVDFKFLNDTGGYVLLQTDIDYKKQLLIYTLWGTSDGRRGWYSHPTVSQWFAPGDKQEVETDTLAPGVIECQPAYRGARARFTYTRLTSTTERIERVFDSYYRPLPEICLVGKAAASSTPETNDPALFGEPGN